MVRNFSITFVVVTALGLLVNTSASSQIPKPAYRDDGQRVDKSIEDLLSRMTLKEKLGQQGFECVLSNRNTASGQMIHRVWIGYFASRNQAVTFIRQNQSVLGGAMPVHR